METLAEIDSCISRLSKMGAQEAFFHPDFVRLLSLLKSPYLYDGKGTEVPKETLNRILLLVAEKAEGMPRNIVGDDYWRHTDICAYALNALSDAAIDAENADSFVRIFLAAAQGGTPPRPVEPRGGYSVEDTNSVALFETASHRDAVFQKMLDFRSPELCACIAERISGLAELRESAAYLFSVALDQSSSGLELDICSIVKLAKFARRWREEEIPSPGYKRALEEGNAHFSERLLQFERAISAFLRQIREAQRQRLARVYDLQEFRARWKENRSREAAIARDDSHLTRRLRIYAGRC